MLKEFKAFAMQGNMLDMAVGIPKVGQLKDRTPPKTAAYYRVAPEGADVNMASADDIRKAGGVVLAYGVFINAVISFLIVAMALFFVVKGMNKMKKAEAPAPAPAPAGPTAEELLADIRDLLKKG